MFSCSSDSVMSSGGEGSLLSPEHPNVWTTHGSESPALHFAHTTVLLLFHAVVPSEFAFQSASNSRRVACVMDLGFSLDTLPAGCVYSVTSPVAGKEKQKGYRAWEGRIPVYKQHRESWKDSRARRPLFLADS